METISFVEAQVDVYPSARTGNRTVGIPVSLFEVQGLHKPDSVSTFTTVTALPLCVGDIDLPENPRHKVLPFGFRWRVGSRFTTFICPQIDDADLLFPPVGSVDLTQPRGCTQLP